ncbi:M15 family metallopeptidase [Anaerocolumna aminovalerica]|nr:M15 family metallopeptidase [Anaerocolumna aminovalerica]
MDTYFYYEEISENVFNKIKGKSYGEDCTVPRKDLRYIRVLHYGFDEKTHIGELIVNKAIAKDIVEIFKELYEAKYPIEKMVLIDAYDADDNTSMADNNTSSFNFRPVPGGSHLSKHALGLAIDINPLYNPYVQYMKDKTVILPVEGSKYADRSLDNPYYIRENDVLFKAFTKRGFSWGGFWKTEPDYQHFVKKID